MAILRIKQQNGKWVDVASLKGEKGDTGEVTAAEYERDKVEIQEQIDSTQEQIGTVRNFFDELRNVHERDKVEIQEQIDAAQEQIDNTQEQIDTAVVKANVLEKRIVNLEQGITPSPFNTDSTVAYQKDVPENALPYAEVSKVGGMTRKCTNLWKFGDLDFTRRATLTFDEPLQPGTYTFSANVTSTDTDATYSLVTFNSGGVDGSNVYGYLNHDASTTTTIELVNPVSIVYINASSTLANSEGDNATFTNIMLNVGSTALPYEPYFEGLRSAPVTEVESVGANLFSGGDLNFTGYTEITLDKPLEHGTYTLSACATSTDTDSSYCLVSFFQDGKPTVFGSVRHGKCDSSTVTLETPVSRIRFNASDNVAHSQGDTATITNIMLNKGTTALPYKPYREPITLPIPAEVQALDGYGEGVNESVYNYIDWEKKQFVKRVGKVDMGALNWKTGSVWYATISGRKTGYTNVLCGKHKNAGEVSVNSMGEGTILGNGTLEVIYVKDNSYPDVDTFKAAMSGVMLYYELATPVVTDISHILSEDNFIGVEGNGTVTLKNEYSYDVPSEITYQIKEVTV